MKAALALAVVTACATAVAGASAETYPNVDVYRVDARGYLTDLTSNPALDTSPSPSPDGSRIAFVSSRSGSPEIYAMSASGGAPVRLTTSPFEDQTVAWNDAGKTSIAWSPDGKRIAFDVQNATFPPTCQTNCVTWSVYIVKRTAPACTRSRLRRGRPPGRVTAGFSPTRIWSHRTARASG